MLFKNKPTILVLLLLLCSSLIVWGQACTLQSCVNIQCGQLNVGFTPIGGPLFCDGATITLTNNSDPGFDFFVMDWSDGTLDTLYNYGNFTHVYNVPYEDLCELNSPEAYAVCFLGYVSCAAGYSCQTGSYDFGLELRPTASFESSSQVCVGNQSLFEYTGCHATDWSWDFGDGNTSTQTDPSHTFSSAGSYNVCLTVQNGCGDDSVCQTVQVVEYPIPDFNMNPVSGSGCAPLTIDFTNLSNFDNPSGSNGLSINWTIDAEWTTGTSASAIAADTIYWEFTDTSSMELTSTDIEVIFNTPGDYEVTLLASNACDVNVEFIQIITVIEPPEADIIAVSDPCTSEDFIYFPVFENMENVDDYQWSFPGGSPSTYPENQTPPEVIYSGANTYDVILTLSNGCGSLDITDQFTIIDPDAGIDFDDLTFCTNDPDYELDDELIDGDWSGSGVDFGDGFDPSDAGVGEHELVFTQLGCVESILSVTVCAPPTIAINDTTFCLGNGPYFLSASPTGGYWQGVGIIDLLSGEFDAPIGDYDVTYFYSEPDCDCDASQTIQVDVINPDVSLPDTLTYCTSVSSAVLTAPGTGTWSGSGISDAGEIDPSSLGEGIFTFTYCIDVSGCSDCDDQVVEIITSAVIDAGSDLTVCINEAAIQLMATEPPGGTWTGQPGLSFGALSPEGEFDPAIAGQGDYLITYSLGSVGCSLSDELMITVLDVVAPQIDQNALCANQLPFDLTATPSGGVWSGEGIIDSVNGTFNPDGANQSYDITYTYTSGGCTGSITSPVYVEGIPDFGFGVADIACINEPLNFIIDGGSGVNCTWDFGDGTTSSDCDVIHEYMNFGTYSITLTVETPLGCNESLTQDIFITQPPTANFDYDADLTDFICTPYEVNFTDLSDSYGADSELIWSMGNGDSIFIFPDTTYSNIANEGIFDLVGGNLNYIYEGDYIISDTTFNAVLSINNPCGSESYTQPVQVSPTPQIIFSPEGDQFCSGTPVEFNNISLGNPESFEWDFGDGSPTVTTTMPDTLSHVFTTGEAPTTYTVTIMGSNNCGDDIGSFDIEILPNNVYAFFYATDSVGCAPLTINFEDFSTEGDFTNWDFGDGNVADIPNPIHTFEMADTFLVTEVVSNGCAYDTSYLNVIVQPQPTINLTIDPNPVCAEAEVNFSLLSNESLNSYIWTFGAGDSSTLSNPTYVYDEPGTYTISAEISSASSGCTNSFEDSIVVLDNPTAAFEPEPLDGCSELEVAFTNESINADYATWTFGNGESSTDLSPTHLFEAFGDTTTTYEIQLVAVDNVGCTDSISQNINVYGQPFVDFTPSMTEVCGAPFTLNLENLTTGAQNYEWDFGDGSPNNNEFEPEHIYTEADTFTIVLNASNLFNCEGVQTHDIIIHPQPIASFSTNFDEGCEDLSVIFTHDSPNTTDFEWDFGDGNNSNEENPTHIYTEAGIYDVILTVNYEGICDDTIIMEEAIEVYPAAEAAFDFDLTEGCQPLSVNFENLSLEGDSYIWSFGTGDTSYVENPTHEFSESGIYTVSLSVISANGCTDEYEWTDAIEVFPQPIANFTPEITSGCQELTVDFNSTSENANTYLWDFGFNNAQSTDEGPSYTYTEPGLYDVQLIAYYDDECSDTLLIENAVEVYIASQANFTFNTDPICEGDSIYFMNLSLEATSFEWDFGDGTISYEENPVQSYSIDGDYEITLTVTSENGCEDTFTAPYVVTVYPQPNLDIDVSDYQGCEPLLIQFDNSSTDATDYYWDLGDGSFSYEFEPENSYDVGSYTPILYANYEGVCNDSTTLNLGNIQVLQSPVAQIDWTEPDPENKPGWVEFENFSLNADSYDWDFGDGDYSSEFEPTHQYYIGYGESGMGVHLTAYNEFCEDDTLYYMKYTVPYRLYVPNALMPLHDKKEVREFLPKGIGLTSYHIKIFSKWGKLLWENEELTEDGQPAKAWTGYYKGELQPQGTYIWSIEAVFNDNSRWPGQECNGNGIKKTVGDVNLIR